MKTVSILAAIAVLTFYASAQECCNPKKISSAQTQKAISDEKPAKNVANRTSIYKVPLVCPAAPEIGCGSRSKPILQELEQQAAVEEAWLNRVGTLLAVVWKAKTNGETHKQVIQSVAEKRKLSLKELDGKNQKTAVKQFIAGEGWYRNASVDQLSEEEAAIIAKRLVRRIEAKLNLSDETVGNLENAFSGMCKHRFIDGSNISTEGQLEKEFLTIANQYLDEKGIRELKEAVALGYLPQPNEK